jgi:hypothetical protein
MSSSTPSSAVLTLHISRRAFFALGALLLAGLIYFWMHYDGSPAVTRETWVDQLATKVGPEYATMADLNTPEHSVDMVAVISSIRLGNAQLRHLAEIYRLGEGRYGLARFYSSVEGDLIRTWVIVKHGDLQYIKDSTRDRHGTRAVTTYDVKALRVGFYRKGKFVNSEPGPDDSAIVAIELDIGRREWVRF